MILQMSAEVMADQGLPVRLVRGGLSSVPDGVTGTLPFMYARYGIGRDELAATAERAIRAIDSV